MARAGSRSPRRLGAGRAGRRVLAFLLDYLVLLAWMGLLFGVSGPLGLGDLMGRGPGVQHAVAFLVLTVPVVAYFALSEASPIGGTLGRRLVGLRVARPDGTPAGLPRTLARNALKFLPWEIAHAALHRVDGWPLDPAPPGPWHWTAFSVALLLSLLWFATAMIGRTPYGLASGTVVLRREISRFPSAEEGADADDRRLRHR